MNTRNLFKFGALLVVLFLIATVSGFAQTSLSTVYVDVTNGSDSYTGANATNNPAGTGPKATIKEGLKVVANSGTLVLVAGDYNGFDNAATSLTINAANCPNITTGFTIQLVSLNSNTKINLTSGSFVMNLAGATVNITSPASEYITFSAGNVTLTAGFVNFASNSTWVVVSGTLITINGGGGFTNAGPKKSATTDAVSLSYIGTGTINAGGETALGDYKAGTLTVNRTLATDAVNFGSTAMTFASATVTSGTVTFNGDLTVKTGNLALAGAGTKTFNGKVTTTNNNIANTGAGNVNFNGTTVAMGKGDISNSAAGNFTFSSGTAVTLAYSDADGAQTALGQIYSNSGSLTFNGPVSWSGPTAGITTIAKNYITGGGGPYLSVENAGGATTAVSFAQGITFNSPANDGLTATGGTTLNNYGVVMKVQNTGAGTLALGTMNTPTDAADETNSTATVNNRYITLTVENSSTGAMSLAGTIYGDMINTSAVSGSLTITGATEVDGILTNASGGTKTLELGANTLTLVGAVTQLTNTGTINATTGGLNAIANMTFNGGTLSNLTVKAAKTVIFSANSTVSTLTVNGSVTVNDNIVLTGTNVSQTGSGTITLSNDTDVSGVGGTLTVLGDLNRSGGTFTAGTKSLLSFAGTSGTQSVIAGPNFQAVDVTFNNGVGAVTLNSSLRASGNIVINDLCTVALGTYNIIMNGASTSFNVNTTGRYTASGGGGLVLGGINTVVGGTAVNGISLLGTGGTYSYITVDVAGAPNVVTANSNIKFDGVLTLRSGRLDVATTKDVSPTGTSATIVRYIDVAPGIGLVGSGTFNALLTAYGLTYTGTLTADRTVGAELTAQVNTWNIDVDCETGGFNVDLSGTANTTFGGNLIIGPVARLRIPTNAFAATFALSKAGGAHVIKGKFIASATDVMSVTGSSATVTGSTVAAEPAIVGNFMAGNNANVTVTNVKSFTGTITTNTGSALALGMGATSADQIIVGAVSLGGNSLTLTTAIEAKAGVTLTFATGALNFGANVLTVSTATGFVGNASTNTYTMSSGGKLLMKTSPLNLVGATIPNLEINGALTLGGDAVVSGAFTQTTGTVTNAGFNFTIGGSYAYAAGSFTGTGQVIFTTTGTATFGASASISNITLNSPGTVTFSGSARLITVSGVFTHTLGSLSLGSNGLVLSGSTPYIRANSGAGTITASTGTVEFTGATPTYTAGSDNAASITNLTFNGTTSLTNSNNLDVLTVTGTLYLKKGAINAASGTSATTLVLGNGATIDRLNGTLTKKPVYANQVNIKYSSLGTTFSGVDLVAGGLTATTNTPASAGTIFGYPAHGLVNGDLVVMSITSIFGGTLAANDKANYDAKVLIITKIDANSFTARVAKSNTVVVLESAGPGGDLVTLKAATTADDMVVGNEFPISSQTTVLKDLTIDRGPKISIDRNVLVNGTLNMLLGRLDKVTATPAWVLTIASGGTIVKQGDATFVLTPVVTTYNLTYSGGYNVTTTSSELQSGTGIAITTVTVSGAGTVLYLGSNLSMANLTLNASGGGVSLLVVGNGNGRTLTVTGNVTLTAGNFISGVLSAAASTNPALIFAGTAAQTLTVPAAGWTLPNGIDAGTANGSFQDIGDTPGINIQVNNTAATDVAKVVTLAGGNFTMGAGGVVQFTSGVINIGTAFTWTLIQGSNPSTNQPTQGFTRTLATGAFGHFVGNVKKYINNTTGTSVDRSIVTFPVGTIPTSPGYYRPYSIYFKSAPQSAVNITVSAASTRPGGANGFPIREGGLVITNYPDFFWFVKSDISLAPSYLFDMEAQAEGYTDYATDGIQNLRFVRRDSGLVTNQWVMQKNNNTGTVLYDNSTIAANWPAVKVVDATGGLSFQGSIFSFSQINKAPAFAATPVDLTVNEGDAVALTFSASDPDLGDVMTLSSVTLPTGATFNAATGALAWTVPYDVATKTTPTATVTVKIRATDTYGPLSADKTITITVNNVNRKPSFAATGAAKLAATTMKNGEALSFSYIAVDPDGDALVYSNGGVLPTGATISAAGALAWTPTFAQAGSTYPITVVANDGFLTDTTVAVVTVNRNRVRGDVDGNGTIQAADATPVLQHVAGITILTDAAALFAADASNNGTISAYDAAMILQAAAGLITLPASADESLAKRDAVEAAGSLSWASPEVTKDAEVLKLGLNLANAANVYAVQLAGKVNDNLMTIEAVNVQLPEGWEMKWNVVDGELRVAMAGATPLSSGSVAAVMVRLKNKESRLNFSADVMLNETSQPLGAVEIAAVPTEFALQLNYPNPFNPSTTIKYQIANDANVNLDIWNLQGQKIRTLVGKEQKSGYYSVVWDGRNEAGQTVSTGLYLYRVQAGSFVATHKMLLIK